MPTLTDYAELAKVKTGDVGDIVGSAIGRNFAKTPGGYQDNTTVATTTFTGSLTETSITTATIPANTLGNAGYAHIHFSGLWTYGTSASSRLRLRFGNLEFCNAALPDASVDIVGDIWIQNDLSTSKQLVSTSLNFGNPVGTSGDIPKPCNETTLVDTTTDQVVDFRADLNTATDSTLGINSIIIETKKYTK